MLGFTSSCWICGWWQKSQTTKRELKGKRFNHIITGTVIALHFVNVKADGNIFYPAAGNGTPFRTFTTRTTALYPPPLLHSNHKTNISPFGCNHTPPKINSYLFLLANAIKNAIITKNADFGVGSNNNFRSITMNSSATTTTKTITTTKTLVAVSPGTTTSTGSASKTTLSTSSGQRTNTSPKQKINFHQAMFLCILQGSISSEFICFLSKKLQKWQQKRLCKKIKEQNNNESQFYEDGNGKDHQQQQQEQRQQQQQQQQEIESAPITVISCINFAVYCLWQFAIKYDKQPELLSTKMYISMYRHAFLPYSLLRIIRRPHTIVSSAFSHNNFFHLFNNMKALILVGTTLAKRMGIRAFSWIYVASAYGSHMIGVLLLPTPYTSLLKFSSLAGNKLKSLLRIPFNDTYSVINRYSLFELKFFRQLGLFPGGIGASGAISALETFFCLDEFSLLWSKSGTFSNDSSDTQYWKRNLWIFELVPIIQEIFTLYSKGLDDSGIIHSSQAIHFGGYIFGVILYGACVIKRYIGLRFFEKENKKKKI